MSVCTYNQPESRRVQNEVNNYGAKKWMSSNGGLLAPLPTFKRDMQGV